MVSLQRYTYIYKWRSLNLLKYFEYIVLQKKKILSENDNKIHVIIQIKVQGTSFNCALSSLLWGLLDITRTVPLNTKSNDEVLRR